MEHSTTCLIRFGHHIPFAFCQYNLGTCHHNMMLNLDVLRSVGIACKLAHYALVPLPQQIILLVLFFLRKNYSSDSESVVFGSIFIVSLKSLGQKAFTPGALASSHVYRRTPLSHDRGSALPPAVFFLMLGLTCDHSSVDFATPLPPLASPRATDRC
jgi:hypothetical protein